MNSCVYSLLIAQNESFDSSMPAGQITPVEVMATLGRLGLLGEPLTEQEEAE